MADIRGDTVDERSISIPGANAEAARNYHNNRMRQAVLAGGGIDHEFPFSLADVLSISNFYSFQEGSSAYFAQFENALYELSEDEYNLLTLIFRTECDDVSKFCEVRMKGARGDIYAPLGIPGYRDDAFLRKHGLNPYDRLMAWEIWDAIAKEKGD